MPDLSRPSTSWRQSGMWPPALVQVRLDVGWAPDHSIGMYAAECYVPNTRELLALEVHPSARYDSLDHFLDRAARAHLDLLSATFNPDPF